MSDQRRKGSPVLGAGLTGRGIVVPILLAMFSLGVAVSSGPAFAQNAMGQGGFDSTSLPPRVVNLGDLPQATAGELSVGQGSYRPLKGISDAQYWVRKQLARERAAAGLGGAKGPAPSEYGPRLEGPEAPTIIGLSPVFVAQQQNGSTPSDMALAVSNNFVVQFVNTFIAVYDKSGVLQPGFPKSAVAFFQVAKGTFTTDPRGFYDWKNQRFVFIMLTETNPFNPLGPPNKGGLLIAASQTADPTGAWFVYSPTNADRSSFIIGNPGECPDYPTLGNDSNSWGPGATQGGIYIGINQFGTVGYCSTTNPKFPNPTFIGNHFFMIPKDPLYSGSQFKFWHLDGAVHNGTLVDTLQAANMLTPADRPSSVLILNSLNINFDGPSGLVAWSVSNPFGWLNRGAAPVSTGVDVSTGNYSLPPAADEPDGHGGICAGCIDTDDVRISGQVTYHAGELFAALTTAVSGSSAPSFMWFDVHVVLDALGNAVSASERQEGCLFCGFENSNNTAYFYATPQPDSENNLFIVFDVSSDIRFPGIGYVSRRVNFSDGDVAAINPTVFTGKALFQQGCNGTGQNCRWGDYTATAPDLTNSSRPAMWFSGQYSNGAGNWGTGIAAGRYRHPTDQ